MQNPMNDLNKCLAVLMLRTAKCKHDEIAEYLGCGKKKVGATEKWFEDLHYEEAIEVSDDYLVESVRKLELDPLKNMLPTNTQSDLDKVNSTLIRGRYGLVKIKESKPFVLLPRPSEHHARLATTSEKLRLNIKRVKEVKGVVLVGDIARGYLETKTSDTEEQLEYVDILDAECLLSHLKAMYPDYKDIKDWQKFDSEKSVVNISDIILEQLKEVSHGMRITGSCRICASWA